MTGDPSPADRPAAGRLWTDPREAEEHAAWLEPKRPIVPLPSTPQPAAPGDDGAARRAAIRRQRLVAVLIGTAIAALLVAAGVLGAKLFGASDSPNRQPAALPVVKGAAPADARSRSIRAIYASAQDSVLPIRVHGLNEDASGTGFVVDKGGVIVTNAHVVKDAERVQVRLTNNGAYIDAKVVGTDISSDLAVLHVDSPAASRLRPLPLADSDNVRVGDQTLAIGYPLGLNRSASASAGIVSGLGRSLDAANNFSIDKVIQTDASINPGNSGGPLLDSAGRVIGVDAAILTAQAGGGSVGIGFAIPSNTLREVVPRLEQGKQIDYAYLGVETREDPNGTGAYVGKVVAGGPAAAAGLQAGDTIVGVGGQRVTVPDDVSSAVEGHEPGDRVGVQVKRGGARKTLSVTLGTRPQTAPGATPATP
jgi:putative serine protease PepD